MTRTEIEERIEELYDKLDQLEGCEGNEVYEDEIRKIRNKIGELDYMEADPEEFELEVTIVGKVTIKAETLKEAERIAYDACKNHEFIAVQRVEVIED